MFPVAPIIKRFHVMVLGNTMDSHMTFLDDLTSSPNLSKASSLKDSDVIIAFVPIASQAGTDILAAMEKIPDGKPVVLVALHHTFDPGHLPSDSRRLVDNERVFAVDCLFHEGQGLLRCPRNDDAIRAVKELLIGHEIGVDSSSLAVWSRQKKFHVMVFGKTMDSHKTFLKDLTISLKPLDVSLKDSEVIIAFVSIASRAGTDISAALEKIPDGKPVVLVALHHTFDPGHLPPDSRRCVNNERVFAVDCLFHEDQGLLRCPRNDDAIRAVKELLKIPEGAMLAAVSGIDSGTENKDIVSNKIEVKDEPKKVDSSSSRQKSPGAVDDVSADPVCDAVFCAAIDAGLLVWSRQKKFHVMVFGKTMDSHKTFLKDLTISPKPLDVSLKDSEVIIAFVSIVSLAGTDISAALEKIPDGKPVVLVVLHHTFDPDYIASDSRRLVNNERVFAVDCLFHEDQGLLRCPRNDDAIRAVKELLKIPERWFSSFFKSWS